MTVCLSLSASAATLAPESRWRQYRTEHFIVIYPQRLETIAREIGPLAEEAYGNVSRLLGYSSSTRTSIVVRDDMDDHNGFATLLPHKLITAWVQPAVNGKDLWDTRTKDDLKLLIEHEFTHIAHLDTRGGIYPFLATLFGPVFSPNLYLPRAFTEGIAVYAETKFDDGRGEGSLYDMIIRTDFMEGNLRPIDRALVFTRQWPGGAIPYAYGYTFVNYLAKTYGEEKLQQWIYATGSSTPLIFDGAFEDVYGTNTDHLWKEWQQSLPEQYFPLPHDTTSEGAEVLFHSGGSVREMILSPDGSKLYFYWQGKDNFPALVSFDIEKKKLKKLSKGMFDGRIAVTADGEKLFYAKQEPYHINSDFVDLYTYDVKKHRERRLTRGKRARDVAVDPAGQRLVYVLPGGEGNRVEMMDLETKATTPIPTKEGVFLWHSPIFSRDGKLAILGQRRDGIDDIYLWEEASSTWKKIDVDANWITDLSWDTSGTTLYFTTDIGGIPNIHAYSLTTHKQLQLTTVVTGAFQGNAFGEHLYFAQYTSSGFDIKHDRAWWPLRANSERVTNSIVTREEFRADRPPSPQSFAPDTRYHPLKQLLIPSIRLPFVGDDESGTQAGLFLYGADVLERHQYQAMVLYGFESGRPSYDITYTYDRWYPTFTLSTFDIPNLSSGLFQDTSGAAADYWDRKRGAGLGISIPLWRRSRTSFAVRTSYLFQSTTSLTSPLPTPIPFTGDISSLSGGFDLEHLETSRYAISPERGFVIAGTTQRADARFGSDLNRTVVLGELHTYWPSFFKRHVLYASGRSGMAFGDSLLQGDFKLGGNVNLEFLHPENDFFPVRGYPARSLVGSRFFLGQVEYRFPLIFIERGLGHGPIFFDNVSLVGFYDFASAWDPGMNRPWRDSSGGELHLSTQFFYGVPFTFLIGVAHGLRDTGETVFYYGVGGMF